MTSPLGTGVVSTYPVNAGLAPNVDALLVWGYRWGNGPVGAPATVTYSFPSAGATWIGDYWDSEPFNGFSAFNAAQQTAAKQALALWSEVANISFTQVADTPTNVGDIRFANSNAVAQAGASAWAYFPYETPNFQYPEAGDVWFNPRYSPNFQLQPSQFGFSTMIHEIGHAIGLDHPFADPGNPGEIALPPNLDNESYSIMSYTINDTTMAYSSSPMLFDILAIQYIYGANMTTRTGNDVYKYSATVEVQKTIWDAGGIDTLDFSNQTRASTIDLNAGTFTRFGGTTPTTSSLIAIAYGVTIENAIGGSGADYIMGNAAANLLDGRGGADTLIGGDGDDIYVIDNVGDSVTEGGTDKGDELRSANILLTQRAGIEHYTYSGAAAWNFTSQAGENNRLTGGTGINILSSGDGEDYLDGGGGADLLRGGSGTDVYVVDNIGDGIDEQGNLDADDRVFAGLSVDLTVLGDGALEHVNLIGTGAFNAFGNNAVNRISGNAAANILDGRAGADVLFGGDGSDTYIVDDVGDEVMEVNALAAGGIDTIKTSVSLIIAANVENAIVNTISSNINITGNELNNVITGNSGNNRLDGKAGNDTMTGGEGNDTYVVNAVGDVVRELIAVNGGVDTIETSINFSLATQANIENLTLLTIGDINGTGNGLFNIIRGNVGINTLDGAGGADWLFGGAGNDTYVIDNVGDVVDEEGNTDKNDEVRSANILLSLMTGIENYTYTGAAAWSLTALAGENNKLSGGSGIDTLNGADGNDTLLGNLGNDVLNGGTGDDYLDGGAGADKMKGGSGDDSYVVDNAGDVIDEEGNADANDKVYAAFSIDLTVLGAGTIESANLLGTAALNVFGSATANQLTGNAGANILDGRGGADILSGGDGADTYVVDDAGDQVIEVNALAAGGVDTIKTSVSIILAANVENAIVNTISSNVNITGNELNNVLTGNSGDNRLDGKAGNDTMTGGEGNDTYVVNAVGDVVRELIAANGGIDTIETSINFSLATQANIENLTLLTIGDINGTGNGLFNIIRGNVGANIIDGAGGADWLFGGAGNDTYVVDNIGDVVDEEGNTDTNDEVRTTVAISTFFAGIEKYTYTGAAAWTFTADAANNQLNGGSGIDTLNGDDGNDTLLGNAGNDVLNGGLGIDYLDGGIGADKLKGGADNDIYVIDNVGDIVDEEANTDTDDEARSSAFLMKAFAGVEHYTYTGTTAWAFTGTSADNRISSGSGNDTLDGGDGNDVLVGNEGNDTLIGGIGDDWLDGKAGDDKMSGGAGNDTYIVNSPNDLVNEQGSLDANDTIQASISIDLRTMGDGAIEHAVLLTIAALNATGNNAANKLTGNVGANTLNGLAGADIMTGGEGSDTYVVDDAGDQVIETVAGAPGGTDLVQSSVSFDLTALANVEHVTLQGTANINATGNGQNNILTGNDGANQLDGRAGDDTLVGGKGDDTYVVDSSGDVVSEIIAAGGGTDTVKSSVTFSLATLANIENLTLTGTAAIDGTGNALVNTILGNSGANILDGGAGADVLKGGAGNDTYVIDNAGDVIDEEGNTDTGDVVKAAVSVTLTAIGGNQIENVILLGGLSIDATGNNLANTLTGNDFDNILDGSGGADTLIGGQGNDTYILDSVADQVIENANSGTDTIKAGFSVNLASFANVENITLLGTGNFDATGDGGINFLIGNAGSNVLDGQGGTNFLDGGAGADILKGGVNSDVFFVDDAGDQVIDLGGNDLINSYITYSLASHANIEQLTLLGTADIDATGNGLDNFLTGNDGDNVLDGGGGIDLFSGGKGDDTYIIDDVNEQIFENVSGGIDTLVSSFGISLAFPRYANVENVTLTGNAAVDIYGTAAANKLIGNSADNDLNGLDGADILIGGDGDDFLAGGVGKDLLVGGVGADYISLNGDGDVVDFDHLNEGSDQIHGFKVGAGGNTIDLRDVLTDVGYAGSNPFADGYVSFTYDGFHTTVRIDADGAGAGAATVMGTLYFANLTQSNTDNYIV